MAIIAPNGNYIKILNIEPLSGNIITERWESKAHRDSGATEFYRPVVESYSVPVSWILQNPVEALESLKNNIIKAGYQAIKQTAQFQSYTDEI